MSYPSDYAIGPPGYECQACDRLAKLLRSAFVELDRRVAEVEVLDVDLEVGHPEDVEEPRP